MPKVVFMRHAKTDRNQIGQFAGRADCNTTPEGLEKAKDSFAFSNPSGVVLQSALPANCPI